VLLGVNRVFNETSEQDSRRGEAVSLGQLLAGIFWFCVFGVVLVYKCGREAVRRNGGGPRI
jgi:hypothetical protein